MLTNRLGCLTSTGILATLLVTMMIAGFAIAGGGSMFSPGGLNATQGATLGGVSSHADIAGACQNCHAAPWEKDTMDDRCSTCHADIVEELKDPTSIHGEIAAIDPSAKCSTCHPEHHGPTALLTVLDGWPFPHDTTRFSLEGHQLKAENEPFQCADCHGADVTKFDQATCRECHLKMNVSFMVNHKLAFGNNCLACHDGVDRFGNDFNHDQFVFNLVGKHAGVPCLQCHVNAHTVGTLKATAQDCFSCHKKDDPHEGLLGTDCASCHTPAGWSPSSFDHNRSIFKLTGAHTTVACRDCHLDDLFKGTPSDCASCHQKDDPHKGQLGPDCARCHNTTDWNSVNFDHSQSDFPLLGKHENVECKLCHKDLLFKSTPTDCASCHVDAHDGQVGNDCAECHIPDTWHFVHFNHNKTDFKLTGSHANVDCLTCHVNGRFVGTPSDCFSCHAGDDAHMGQFGTVCSQCHVTSSWQEVNFDHNSFTAFPLIGSHASVACTSCHVNGVYKGTPKDCYSCHAAKDAHNGQFGTDCGSCHKPTKWQDVTFDHNKTAFPLIGHHASLACSSCHADGVYKGKPTDCFSCHANDDNHNGQFGTDCRSCHSPTGWSNISFDHNKSAFPLTGQHANLNCSQCHGSGQFKGTPTDCASCHSEPAFHAGAFGTDCAQCHTTSGWTPAQFIGQHPVVSGQNLLNHHGATCKTCHTVTVHEFTCLACHDSNNP